MITLKSHLEAKGISTETFDGYTAEVKAGLFNEVNEINAKEFKALKEVEGENSKAIAKMSEALVAIKDDQLTKLNDALKAQGVVLRKLEKGEGVSEEAKTLKSAVIMIENQINFKHHRSVVLHNDDWHPGVIGIVASRIAERFYRPTILISTKDDKQRSALLTTISSSSISAVSTQGTTNCSVAALPTMAHTDGRCLHNAARSCQSFRSFKKAKICGRIQLMTPSLPKN